MRWICLALLALLPLFLPQLAHASEPCPSDAIEVLEDRRLEKALLGLLRQAEREVWIGTFLFKVDHHEGSAPARLLRELVRLHREGVVVRVLLERPLDPASDLARDNLNTARRLQEEGIHVLLDSARRRSHMKVIVIDRRYTILGSHNLTQSALRYNRELSVLVDSPCLAQKAVSYLERIARDSSPP